MNKKESEKEDKKRITKTDIFIAIISFIGVVLAALIGQDKIFDFFLSRTTITIPANPYYSGTTSGGATLYTFDGTTNVTAFGDTSTNYPVRVFLGFPLGQIPASAKIVDAFLIFKCDVFGNPNAIGRVWMKEYSFWPYSESDYFQVEQANNWKISWVEAEPIMNSCLSRGEFRVITNSLPPAVEKHLIDRYFQIGIFFERNWVVHNGHQDAIVFTKMPVLKVRYTLP